MVADVSSAVAKRDAPAARVADVPPRPAYVWFPSPDAPVDGGDGMSKRCAWQPASSGLKPERELEL